MPLARNKYYKNSLLCKALPSYQTLKAITKESKTLSCLVKNRHIQRIFINTGHRSWLNSGNMINTNHVHEL